MRTSAAPPLLDLDEWPAFDPRWRGVRAGFRAMAVAGGLLALVAALHAGTLARLSFVSALAPVDGLAARVSAGVVLAAVILACLGAARTFPVPRGTAARPLAAVSFLAFLALATLLLGKTPVGPMLGDAAHALDAAGPLALPATKACAFAFALAAGAFVVVATGTTLRTGLWTFAGGVVALDLFAALASARVPARASLAEAVAALDAAVFAFAMGRVAAALWMVRAADRPSEAPGEPLFFPEEWTDAARGLATYVTALSAALLLQVIAVAAPIATTAARSGHAVTAVAIGLPALDGVLATWMAIALASAARVPEDARARGIMKAAVALLVVTAIADSSAASLVVLPVPAPITATVATVGDASLLLATVVLLAAYRRLGAYLGDREIVRRVASVQGFLVIALVVVVASRGAVATGLSGGATTIALGIVAWAIRLVALGRHLGVSRRVVANASAVAEGRLSGAPNAVTRGAPKLA